MNATPHHSKVRVSVTLSDQFYIAGDAITGKMVLESRADKGLGLGIIMVELVAIEGVLLSLHPTCLPVLNYVLRRANFSRPFRNLDIPPHHSPFPRFWLTTIKCCPSPPSRWGAPSTRASPPCPARTHYLSLPTPSPSLLPFVYQLWKRPRQNSIRGPRLCRRRLERPEPARHRQVPDRHSTAVPWRQRCHPSTGR
jgi:hypothetical protein